MIELKNICKKYGKKIVLENISLEAKDENMTVFYGPSGSGKTTILKIIGGLEKPDSGEVLFDNKKMRPGEVFGKIGFVFQNFYLDSDLTISQNIELPGIFAGISPARRIARIKKS